MMSNSCFPAHFIISMNCGRFAVRPVRAASLKMRTTTQPRSAAYLREWAIWFSSDIGFWISSE
jgi:hypothetical protein